MATTATISIASDIWSSFSGINKTMTLTQAGTTTGLDTILRGTKTLTATTNVDLISTTALVSAYTADVATKVYIANTGTSETEYFTIGMGAAAGTQEEIGRLYGGDWMFIPWGVDDDITIDPNVATSMTVEYMVIS